MNARTLFRTGLLAALLAALTPAQAENLLDVYRLAQQNDLTIAQAQGNLRAGVEKRAQGTAQLLPTLTFSATSYSVGQEVYQPSAGRYFYDSESRLLQLTQPLFRMQNFAQYTQGKAQASQAVAEFAVAAGELMIRTVQTYFEVLAAQDTLALARTEKVAIDGQRRLAERSFAVGGAAVVDVHEARARLDVAGANELQAEIDLLSKREALTQLTNTTPASLAVLTPNVALLPPEPADVEHWTRTGQERSPLIVAQELALKAAEDEIARQRGANYPTLDLVASRSYSSTNVFTPTVLATESHTSQIGLQLTVPIFGGGATFSRTREAEARRDVARAARDQSQRTTTRLVRESYLAASHGVTRVRALEQARASSKKALESTLIGYESGVRTGVDVLNTQQALYRTERDLSQARYTTLLNRLKLKLFAGVLSEDDLAETNRLLVGIAP